jgi:hypothetical protein
MTEDEKRRIFPFLREHRKCLTDNERDILEYILPDKKAPLTISNCAE